MAGYADEIIRLILTAKDDTAAAFASASRNQKEYNRLQEEGGKIAEEQGRQSRKSSNQIVEATRREKEALESINKTRSEGLRQSTNATRGQVDALVRLERAERANQAAQTDSTRSFAEQRAAILDSVAAQKNYQRELAATAKANYDRAKAAKAAAIEEGNLAKEQEARLDAAIAKTKEAYELAQRRAAYEARASVARVAATERETLAEKNRQAAARETLEVQEALAKQENARLDADYQKRLDRERGIVEAERRSYQSRISLEEQRRAAVIKSVRDEDAARRSLAMQRAQYDRGFVLGQTGIEQAQDRLNRKTAEYVRQIDKVAAARQKLDRLSATNALGRDSAQRDYDIARTGADKSAREVQELVRKQVVVYDVDTGEAKKELLNFEAAKVAAGRDVNVNVDVDAGAAIATLTAFGNRGRETSTVLGSIGRSAKNASTNIATFDNFLRGLLSLGIVIFLNQIVVVAGAAAGALTSLAASASFAGGALGGSLVAGAAQAIPVLGVLGAAFSRFKAVLDASKQSQLLQQQLFANQGKDAKKAADNTDAVRSAQDGLSAAQRRAVDAAKSVGLAQEKVGDATRGVTEARKEAIKSLEDLILKEKQAQLAAEGANLSLAESQDALRDALASGDTGAIARRRYEVKTAENTVDESQVTANRASADLATRRAQGVSGSPEVVQANRALRDARRGVADAVQSSEDAGRAVDAAGRSLAKAKRSGAEAGTEQSAAAGKLNYLMKDLSASEKELFEQLQRLQTQWRQSAQGISDPLIQAATYGVKRVIELLQDRELVGAFEDVSEELSGQLIKTFDFFTDEEHLDLFKFFANEAEANLEPLFDSIRAIGDAFLYVGKAGSPALAELLDYLKDGAQRFERFSKSVEGQEKIADFFSEGVQQIKVFSRLIGAVSSLLAGVFGQGGGADAGASAIERFTQTIQRLDDKVRTVEGREFLKNFFKTSEDTLAALAPLIASIASHFAEIFNPEGVRNVAAFTEIVGEVLVPALSTFLDLVGDIARTVKTVFDLPGIGPALKLIAATTLAVSLLFGVFAKLGSALAPLGVGATKLGSAFVTAARTSTAAWAVLARQIAATVGLASAAPLSRTQVGAPPIGPLTQQQAAAQAAAQARADAAANGTRTRLQRAGGAVRNVAGRLGGFGLLAGGLTAASVANSQDTSVQTVGTAAVGGATTGFMIAGPVGAAAGAIIAGGVSAFVGGFRKSKREEAAKRAREEAAKFAQDVARGTTEGLRVGLSQAAAREYGKIEAQRTRDNDKTSEVVGERRDIRDRIANAEARLADARRVAAANTRATGGVDASPAVARINLELKGLRDRAKELGTSFDELNRKTIQAAKSQGEIAADALRRRVRRADVINADSLADPIAGFKGSRKERAVFAEEVNAEALRARRQGKLSTKEYEEYKDKVNAILGGVKFPTTKKAREALSKERLLKDYKEIVEGSGAAAEKVGAVAQRANGSLQTAAKETLRIYAATARAAVTGPNEKARNEAKERLKKLKGIYEDQVDALRKSTDPKVRELGRSLRRLGNSVDEAREKGKRPIKVEIVLGLNRVAEDLKKNGGFLGSLLGNTIGGIGKALDSTPGAATGAYIAGQYSKGDIYPVNVAGDEAILNPTQQRMIGRDRIMSVLKATGAKVLGAGGSYASGATPSGGKEKTTTGSEGTGLVLNLAAVLAVIDGFGKEARGSWDKIWDRLQKRTKTGRDDIDDTMKSLVRRVDKSQDQIGSRLVNGWKNINEEVSDQTRRFRRGIASTMDSVKQSTYDGVKYISDATSESLEAFDVKGPKISISAPKAKRAATGYIGNPGERGEDAIPIWVGRGEAVLNAAHQKIVNSALYEKGIDGLNGLFRSNRGYHAGNDQSGIAPGMGFARGGFTGPAGSGEGFNPISAFAKKKFGLTMTSGKTNHSLRTASGNISDHSRGTAGDFSNGVLTPQEDAFSNFWKTKAPATVKQLIWRNKDQFQGFPVGGHEDHVHLAVKDAYAFNASRIAKIISRLSKGLSIDALLASDATGDTPDAEHVNLPKISGRKGNLRNLVTNLLKKVKDGANSFIDKKAEAAGVAGDGGSDIDISGSGADGNVVATIARIWKANNLPFKALLSAIETGIVESGLRNLSGGDRDSAGWRQERASLYKNPTNVAASVGRFFQEWKQFAGSGGTAGQIAANVQRPAAQYRGRYDGVRAEALRIIKSLGIKGNAMATGGFASAMERAGFPAFARGGIVPGGKGSPQPIVAHAGEWVVNERQQSRLAALMGTTADRIKGLLGFHGGPTSFAGGGEVGMTGISGGVFARRRREALRTGKYEDLDSMYAIPEGDFQGARAEYLVGAAAIRGAFKKLNEALRKTGKKYKQSDIEKNIELATEALTENTKEGGLLDQLDVAITTRIEKTARLLQTKIFNANKGLGKVLRGAFVETTLDDDQIAAEQIGDQREALKDYSDQLKRINRDIGKSKDVIRAANKAIKRALGGRSEESAESQIAKLKAIDKPSDSQKKALKQLEKDLESVKDLREGKQDARANLTALRKRAETARTSINETLAAIAEAEVAQFGKTIEDTLANVTSRGGRREADLDRAARRANSRGDVEGAASIADDRLTFLRNQADAARLLLTTIPKGKNYDALRKETEEKVKEADAAVDEAVQSRITDRIEAIGNASATAVANAERNNSFADILDRIGGDKSLLARAMGTGSAAAAALGRGAAGLRASALESKGSALRAEQAGYQQAREEARAAGNIGAVKDLDQKIADLEIAVAENTVAIADNTTAARQVEIDRITNRSGFLTGVYGGLAGLSASVAANTRTPDSARQEEQLGATRNVIIETLSGLSGKLSELTGGTINTAGLTGNALVDYLKSINLDAIGAGMSTADRAQFELLINGIIGNASSLEDNTAALENLKGALSPQAFSSTAWAQFRNAIFNGMGDVLPQYTTVPSFDTGGPVISTGMAKLHKGEYVVAGKGGTDDGRYTSYNDAPINVEINEAGGPVDITNLTARLAWEKRRNRGNR